MRRIVELRDGRPGGVALATASLSVIAAVLLGAAQAPGLAPGGPKCKGKAATITKNDNGKSIGNGNDSISGTQRADVIVSLGGKDEVFSGGGDDLICTGGGNDYVVSDTGDDRIYGGDGIDYLVAYTGDDRIYGGDGDDWSPGVQNKKPGRNGRLVGANGDDKIFGGGGDVDLCSGGKGFDRGSECEQLSGVDDPGWTPSGRRS